MREKIEQFVASFDERTGIYSGLKHFLYEEIPASSGWHQILGSLALFLILVQFFTGIMLSFNYAPTPGDAYDSVRYILTDVTAGRLMRGLHHWGASMIIVIVVLHMVQVFLYGAYKKPREGTWIAGVVLLLLTLAFGLTGYLLPWDNRAYWGTTVTTSIGATVPLAGPYVSRLLASTGDIGVQTFARFYALHVLILPPAIILLIVLHVYMVRRHGVAPAPGDEDLPKKGFFPEQIFKDTVAVFVGFAILFTMAIAVRVPLEHMADPTDTAYIPRPEWYFLFLFQMLKVFKGPLEVVGTVVLPTLAILALILTPFIDRSKIVHVRQRTLAFGIVLLAALGWGGLTLAAVKSTPPQTPASEIDYSGPVEWMQMTPAQLAGVHAFQQARCGDCHNVGDGAPRSGPNLPVSGTRHDAAWLTAHLQQQMKANLSDDELRDLTTLMTKLTPDNSEVVDSSPAFAVEGAVIFQKNKCVFCHALNGVGGTIGPPMNGLANRRSEDWVIRHFENPQAMTPGTPMPPYKFNSADMKNEVSYLFTLPSQAPAQ
jgi:ubiquinol-cytochrome c reductase cytochrome b subunit